MTSTMGEIFNQMKADSQLKRARNRLTSKDQLIDHGVDFEERNAGAHIIISSRHGVIDFWPGTGLYIARAKISRNRTKGRGIFNLISLLLNDKENNHKEIKHGIGD